MLSLKTISGSIKKKVLVSFSLLTILFLVIGILVVIRFSGVMKLSAQSEILNSKLNTIQVISGNLKKLDGNIDSFFVVGHVDYQERATINTQEILENIKEFPEDEDVDNLEHDLIALSSSISNLSGLSISESAGEVNRIVFGIYEEIESAETHLNVLLNKNQEKRSENIRKESRYISELSIYLFGLVIISLFSGGGLYLSIISPTINAILRLQQASKKIEEGNLDYRVDIQSKDELGDLADSFNSMASKLQESYKSLEKKVTERTASLEKTMNLMVGRELKMKELKQKNAEYENIIKQNKGVKKNEEK